MKEDICYATTNRQLAVKNIAKKCDLFFVIGSRNSSNSVRLVEVAKKSGCPNSQLIHSQSKIPYELIEKSKTIGISSGASAPEILFGFSAWRVDDGPERGIQVHRNWAHHQFLPEIFLVY